MKRHAPFIAMTIAAFLLLFACIARGDGPSPFLDALPDAAPDANSSTMRGRSTDTEGVSVSADPLPVIKEVVAVSHVTPSVPPDCTDGSCRVGARSQADESAISATRDAPTRPFRARRGLLRRVFSR